MGGDGGDRGSIDTRRELLGHKDGNGKGKGDTKGQGEHVGAGSALTTSTRREDAGDISAPISAFFDNPAPPPLMNSKTDSYSGWKAPEEVDMSLMPAGVDTSAYMAGERAAMWRAFQFSLPSQQALGSLTGNVNSLGKQIEQDFERLQQLEKSNVSLSTTLEEMKSQIDNLQNGQLPMIQDRLDRFDEVISMGSEQTAKALQDLAAAIATNAYSSAPGGSLNSMLASMVSSATNSTLTFVSKMDVALLFLSRKILLDNLGARYVQGRFGRSRRGQAELVEVDRVRGFVGASMFVAAVESSWQIYKTVARPMPRSVQPIVSPVGYGLKWLRFCVLGAAMVLTVSNVKDWCFSVADNLSIARKSRGSPAVHAVPGVHSTRSRVSTADEDESPRTVSSHSSSHRTQEISGN